MNGSNEKEPVFKVIHVPGSSNSPLKVGDVLSLRQVAEFFEINAYQHAERCIGAANCRIDGYAMEIQRPNEE